MWLTNNLELVSPYNPKNWIKRLRKQCEPNQSIFSLNSLITHPPSSTTNTISQAHTLTKGNNVTIAIIDSGIDYTHKEFTPSIELNQDPITTPSSTLQEERKPLNTTTSRTPHPHPL